MAKTKSSKTTPKVKNESGHDPTKNSMASVENGFGGGGAAFFNPFGLPGTPQGAGSPQQLSDTTTLFTNLRWYLVSNFRQVLNQLFAEIGLVQRFVCTPVDDALRGGIEVKSKQLDENEIKELQNSMEQDGDLIAAAHAGYWNRLFGGAGIFIFVGDQDPETPLDVAAIGPDTELRFTGHDMWEFFWSLQNVEGDGDPFELVEFQFYDFYGHNLHKSRVLKMKGIEAPSFIRPRLRGWGLSVVEGVVRALNQFLKTADLTFEILDEFKVDYYKIKNLVNTLLGPNATNKVRETAMKMNMQKNYQHAVVMDSEDDWQQKQLNFTGLSDIQIQNRKQLSAELGMPVSKLFGSSDSASTLGNADQDDMENYNSMIESSVRTPLKFHILTMVQLKCQKLFGFIPDDLEVGFKPLRVLTAEQEENVKREKFARLKAAKDSGDITTQEFRDACNKGNLFDIQLDTSLDAIDPDDPQIEAVLTAETPGEKQEDNPDGEEPKDEAPTEKEPKSKLDNVLKRFRRRK